MPCLSLAATINFSRLGARAFISKTAKSSAKVYFKSTMAGLHPDEQAAGQRVPVMSAHPAAPAASGPSTTLPATRSGPSAVQVVGVPVGMASGGSQSGGVYATRSESASPYPPGSSAAAAAQGVVYTAK